MGEYLIIIIKKIKIILITISIICLAFSFYPTVITASSNTLYVGGTTSDNYTSIQDAIDNSSIGDTIYVYSGEYEENIVISHSINLIGENKNTTVIQPLDGTGNIITISASNVKITGFKIMSGYDINGLIIYEDYNNIFENIFYDNLYAIKILDNANNNIIYNNDFQTNIISLFIMGNANNNKITYNIFIDNTIGINLSAITCFENIIHHNYFKNNSYNAYDKTQCKNQWDDGSQGNFWNDYKGTGPYTISGPYTCKDNYPLTKYIEPDNLPEENQSKIYCKNLGYFIDENNDGIYDLFYSNQTQVKTVTEKQEDDTYLINTDMDNEWDYVYNTQTDALTKYKQNEVSSQTFKLGKTMLYFIIIIIIIIVLIIIILLGKRSKKEKTKEKTKDKKTIKVKEIETPIEEKLKGDQQIKETIETEDKFKEIRDKIDKL